MEGGKQNHNCVNCEKNIDVDLNCDDFTLLKPCGCCCCPKCALSMTANRNLNNVHCPKCEKEVKSIKYFESSRKNLNKGKTLQLKVDPNIEKDPCQFFMKLFERVKPKKLENCMILSLSFTDEEIIADENQVHYVPKTIISVLNRKSGPETKDDCNNLRKIFTLLHYPIIKPHIENIREEIYPRMTAAEFIEYCLYDDKSYLLQLMFSLASGKIEFEPKQRSAKQDTSDFLAICVAKQMIERANNNVPSPFQLMMSDVMTMNNASTEYHDLLSKLRISSGRRTTERSNIKRGIILKTSSIDIPPLGAFVIHIDNFGFLGKQGKWAIHTVIQVSIIEEGQLRKLGFYNKGKISRDRKTISGLLILARDELDKKNDIIDEEDAACTAVAKKIVEPKDEDIAELTRRVLTSITYAINSNLPNAEESELFLSECSESNWIEPIHRNLGYRIPTATTITTAASTSETHTDTNTESIKSEPKSKLTSELEEKDDKKSYFFDVHNEVHTDDYLTQTFYEKNNIQLDNTLHGDPNSYEVVKKVIESLEQFSKKDSFQYDEEACNGEAPVRYIISPATADGAPAKRYLDFLALDIQTNGEGKYENRTHKTARIFMSGLHFQMEFLTMRGRLFHDIFGFFGRKWRKSDPAFNWIHVIRDPKDALNEFPQYILCQYRSAAESAAVVLLIELSKLTAVQVNDYMLDRAIEIPMVMACLFDMRLIEIALMIRDSEKIGDLGSVELFLSTLRLSLALFTITHATNYCHLVSEFLEWWELSSDAEKVLFKNFYYTNLSPSGKPIWVDRGVEWTVRHIRSFIGHRVRAKNHDSMVERVVSDIPFRIKAKRNLRHILGLEDRLDYTTCNWNDQTVPLGKAFHATRVAAEKTNFWGPGPLKGELKCKDNEAGIFFHGDNDLQESRVSSSILEAFEIGVDRSIDYFKEHHINNQYQKTRSEENVSLKLLPTNAKVRKKDLEITRKIRLSTDPNEIEPLKQQFNMDRIIESIDWMREDLYPDIPVYNKKNSTRRQLVEALCEHRQRYFDDFPEVLQRKQEELEQVDITDSQTTEEERKEQIKGRIYQLHENTKNNFDPSTIPYY